MPPTLDPPYPDPLLHDLPNDFPDYASNLRALASLLVLLPDTPGLHADRFGSGPPVAFHRAVALRMRSHVELLAVLSRFCAAYLPNLVNRILWSTAQPTDDRTKYNESGAMSFISILVTSCAPYMHSYVASSQPQARGKMLMAAVLHLVAGLLEHVDRLRKDSLPAPLLDRLTQEDKEALRTDLVVLCTAAVDLLSCFSLDERQDILQSPIGNHLRRMLPALKALGRLPQEEMSARRAAYKHDETGGTRLRWLRTNRLLEDAPECANIPMWQCSKKHQTEDWNDKVRPHKAWCYKTPW
ncbi:hypothetical protein CALCODRAFT_513413 [Calocera cornea HHB12733]|uniref:Uncharacterized protein n=1 Tax=Calocera cornea HHB12733 TaxID=1353952 RepID=A0A165C4U4_9BASI|nr:hypothetical protein CALCODRAFT_513413 [Calocera cornea HHB12733]